MNRPDNRTARLRCAALVLAAVLAAGQLSAVLAAPPLPWDEEARLLMHDAWLASDAREGRGIGTPGLDSSAAYIERRFREAGLEPLFGDSYRQPLPLAWGIDPLPGTFIAHGTDTLRLGEGVQPLGLSGEGRAVAPVIFAGYGIRAPEYDYDDYGSMDVEGKIVLVITGEPADRNPESRFEGTLSTQYSELRNKALLAKSLGAAGLLVAPNIDEADTLPTLRPDEPYHDAGLPALRVTRAALARLLPGFNLEHAQRSIDLNESPRSMPVTRDSLSLAADLRRNEVTVYNIGGVLPGDERLLVAGAHYDHLGYGQEGTREPGVHAPHNGADDNASGVAVLLELARRLAADPPGPTIWFISFTGEEVGLAGSAWFVRHPPAPLEKVKFMLNLDMVGRMRDSRLAGLGAESAKGLVEAGRRAGEGTGLELSLSGSGFGPSDQTSFYAQGVPVMQLFTGAHAEYHTPGDDVSLLNGAGMVRVLDYADRLLREIARPEVKLVYRKSEPPRVAEAKPRGGRPYLGSVPDFTQPDSLRGVRLQGVQPGSPAEKAGLAAGDILVNLDGVILDNLYDFAFALRNHKPGDEIEIVFLRGGERRATRATLAPPGRGHGR